MTKVEAILLYYADKVRGSCRFGISRMLLCILFLLGLKFAGELSAYNFFKPDVHRRGATSAEFLNLNQGACSFALGNAYAASQYSCVNAIPESGFV